MTVQWLSRCRPSWSYFHDIIISITIFTTERPAPDWQSRWASLEASQIRHLRKYSNMMATRMLRRYIIAIRPYDSPLNRPSDIPDDTSRHSSIDAVPSNRQQWTFYHFHAFMKLPSKSMRLIARTCLQIKVIKRALIAFPALKAVIAGVDATTVKLIATNQRLEIVN